MWACLYCSSSPPRPQASKTKVVASGTYVPPKTMNRQVTDSRTVKTHLASSSGVYVPPSNGMAPAQGEV